MPLSGSLELQGMCGVQKFNIHRAGGPRGALMSAHTCFNSLDLPTVFTAARRKCKRSCCMLSAKEVALSCLHKQIHELTTFAVKDFNKVYTKI